MSPILDELKKIPARVNLDLFDISVFSKDKIREIFRAGKLPTADALVDEFILRAVKDGATDIHIEPKDAALSVRLGSEGVLKTLVSLPKEVGENITNVLKTRSGVNQFEKKKAQEGRYSVTIAGVTFEIRVNTLPTINGERVALRLFNRTTTTASTTDLGFSPQNLEKLHHLMRKPSGLVLIAGPSGSGVTTLLNTCMNSVQSPEKNIITLEQSVEAKLDFATQIQIPADKSIPLHEMLRSVLRQSPNVLLLGELRDQEAGVVACEAVLAGILVFSTLLANDAIGAIPRLRNFNIAPYWLATSLAGVISQKLLRKICPTCREEYQPTQEEINYLGSNQFAAYYKGKGCDECGGTGYQGRIGTHEVLLIDDRMRDAIYKEALFTELKEAAYSSGFQDFHADTLVKATEGITTIAEMQRALG